MTSGNVPSFIPSPSAFGNSVTQATIPATSSGNDAMNWGTGFPSKYSLPESSGGKFITRAELNAILNALSRATFRFAYGCFPEYNASMMNEIGGYPLGAVLAYAYQGDLRFVMSMQNNNAVKPSVLASEGPTIDNQNYVAPGESTGKLYWKTVGFVQNGAVFDNGVTEFSKKGDAGIIREYFDESRTTWIDFYGDQYKIEGTQDLSSRRGGIWLRCGSGAIIQVNRDGYVRRLASDSDATPRTYPLSVWGEVANATGAIDLTSKFSTEFASKFSTKVGVRKTTPTLVQMVSGTNYIIGETKQGYTTVGTADGAQVLIVLNRAWDEFVNVWINLTDENTNTWGENPGIGYTSGVKGNWIRILGNMYSGEDGSSTTTFSSFVGSGVKFKFVNNGGQYSNATMYIFPAIS